jgi:hypothetical protein
MFVDHSPASPVTTPLAKLLFQPQQIDVRIQTLYRSSGTVTYSIGGELLTQTATCGYQSLWQETLTHKPLQSNVPAVGKVESGYHEVGKRKENLTVKC